MRLFLHEALMAGDLSKAKGKTSTGEQRGGNYFARVQTGYEKDGSPEYRYFTKPEYDAYLSGDQSTKDKEESSQKKSEKKLKGKQEKERSEEKKKQSKLFTASADKMDKKSSKKSSKKSKVKKALPTLYLEVRDE